MGLLPVRNDAIEGALPPPLGITPNFTNPETCNTETWILLGVCTAVTTISVALRTYTKVFLIKQRDMEDCTYFATLWM